MREREGRRREVGLGLQRVVNILPLHTLNAPTASTATRCPPATRCIPNASMNVDFPAPGGPAIPTRNVPDDDGDAEEEDVAASPCFSAAWCRRLAST